VCGVRGAISGSEGTAATAATVEPFYAFKCGIPGMLGPVWIVTIPIVIRYPYNFSHIFPQPTCCFVRLKIC
jgi:hypothetical protein